MDDRQLDLTEAQEVIKAKYPPINKKYECKCDVNATINNSAIFTWLLFTRVIETNSTVCDSSYCDKYLLLHITICLNLFEQHAVNFSWLNLSPCVLKLQTWIIQQTYSECFFV